MKLSSAILLSTASLLAFSANATDSASQVVEQDNTNAFVTQISPSLFAGLTLGGDKLATMEYEDNSSTKVMAGGLIALGGGLNIQPTEKFSVQLNLGYHFDSATASNADLTFSRVTVEAIPYYHVNDNVRFGAGITAHLSPELSMEINGRYNETVKFDTAIGVVLSGGYQFEGSNNWLEVRAVVIDYTMSNISGYQIPKVMQKDFSGSHVGVNYRWVF